MIMMAMMTIMAAAPNRNEQDDETANKLLQLLSITGPLSTPSE